MSKFWEDTSLNDYQLYEELKRTGDRGRLSEFIPHLLTRYPSLIDYIVNRIDSCFGEHIVYLILTNFGIKVGYTKNSIQERFNERRYSGSESFEIKEIIRQEKFQAKGAVEFESYIKTQCNSYLIQTDMVMPGKGEIFGEEYREEVLRIWDNSKEDYKRIVGIKAPN